MRIRWILLSLLPSYVLFSAESPLKLESQWLKSQALSTASSEASQTLSDLVEIDPQGPLGEFKSDLLEASEIKQVLEVEDPFKEADEVREPTGDIETSLGESWNEDFSFDEELFLSVGKSEEVESTWESSEKEEDPRDPFTSLEMPQL
ncbi:hypothetical protein EBR78_04860 [bacterium]|nr:hypothetical protein [bacterium]NBX83397.1 hypothetical protein [bacterium]